jgi:hypothetical protein
MSVVPLGEPVAEKDAKRLEGVWIFTRGEPVWVKHVKDNELAAAGLEWRQSEFHAVQAKVLVTTDDDRLYLNLLGPERQEDGPYYHLGRLVINDEDDALIIPLNAATFAAAVEKGELPGKTKKTLAGLSVRLDATPAQLNEFVDPEKNQFNVDAAVVLRRVHQFDDNN